jgi:hypothetical protein
MAEAMAGVEALVDRPTGTLRLSLPSRALPRFIPASG